MKAVRDPKYLHHLRSERCVLTGVRATEYESVVPMHIGTRGTGLKSGDDEVIPVRSSLHSRGHDGGEASMLRREAPDWLLREAFRAYAREQYREWVVRYRP